MGLVIIVIYNFISLSVFYALLFCVRYSLKLIIKRTGRKSDFLIGLSLFFLSFPTFLAVFYYVWNFMLLASQHPDETTLMYFMIYGLNLLLLICLEIYVRRLRERELREGES